MRTGRTSPVILIYYGAAHHSYHYDAMKMVSIVSSLRREGFGNRVVKEATVFNSV